MPGPNKFESPPTKGVTTCELCLSSGITCDVAPRGTPRTIYARGRQGEIVDKNCDHFQRYPAGNPTSGD